MDDWQFGFARVCESGHVITPAIQYQPDEPRSNHCGKCGLKVINGCTHCATPIRGARVRHNPLNQEWEIQSQPYERPAFCWKCGLPFPWTDFALHAIAEVVAAEGIDGDFMADIERVARETIDAPVARLRVQKALADVSQGTRKVVYDVLCNLLGNVIALGIMPPQ